MILFQGKKRMYAFSTEEKGSHCRRSAGLPNQDPEQTYIQWAIQDSNL